MALIGEEDFGEKLMVFLENENYYDSTKAMALANALGLYLLRCPNDLIQDVRRSCIQAMDRILAHKYKEKFN